MDPYAYSPVCQALGVSTRRPLRAEQGEGGERLRSIGRGARAVEPGTSVGLGGGAGIAVAVAVAAAVAASGRSEGHPIQDGRGEARRCAAKQPCLSTGGDMTRSGTNASITVAPVPAGVAGGPHPALPPRLQENRKAQLGAGESLLQLQRVPPPPPTCSGATARRQNRSQRRRCGGHRPPPPPKTPNPPPHPPGKAPLLLPPNPARQVHQMALQQSSSLRSAAPFQQQPRETRADPARPPPIEPALDCRVARSRTGFCGAGWMGMYPKRWPLEAVAHRLDAGERRGRRGGAAGGHSGDGGRGDERTLSCRVAVHRCGCGGGLGRGGGWGGG